MKRIIFSLLLLVSFISNAQVRISDLPEHTGNPNGGLLPLTISGQTRKFNAGNFLWNGGSYSNPSWLVNLAPNKLLQSGATPGQGLIWNGTSWAPGQITATVGTLPFQNLVGSPYNNSALRDAFDSMVRRNNLRWDSIIGRPANFTTTYALSNDLRDSLTDRFTKAQSDARYLQSFTELDPTVASHIKAITTTNISNWNTAFGWGNHAGLYRPISYVPAWTDVTGRPTSLSAFTNDVGFITGINSTMVINALGFTPYNSSNPAGYISGINSTMVTNALGYTPENIANKGVANGYADLDANGRIPASRIDFGQTGQTFVVASQAEMLAVPNANIGALAIRTDQNKNYRLIALPASNLSHWIALLSPDAPVQSVNGQTGNVNLTTTNIGEGANLYYTDARARGALSAGTGISYNSSTGAISSTITQYTDALARGSLSFVAGQGAYNSSTGVITIPTNTTHLTNGAGFITGINSTMVTTALGYTPVQPNGTGASGTWGINISGNAATATTATNWSGASGLGSYAYRSSGLAELSGANFTGAISGTSASFSGVISNTDAIRANTNNANGTATIRTYFNNAEIAQFANNAQVASTTNYGFMQRNDGANFIGGTSLDINSTLNGTSATFSSTGIGVFNSQMILFNPTSNRSIITFQNTLNGFSFGFNSTTTQRFVFINGGGDEIASINTSGAATFSSSVTASSFSGSGSGLTNVPWSSITGAPSFLTTAVTTATGTANQITVSASTGAVTFSLPSAVTISGNMTAGAFFESSDIRLKNVHQELGSKDGINAIKYTLKSDGTMKWGYSAQQIKNVLPFAVSQGSDSFLKVDYTTVHTYKIAMLEQRIYELEKQLKK